MRCTQTGKQVVVGLAVDEEGFVKGHEAYEGSRTDITTFYSNALYCISKALATALLVTLPFIMLIPLNMAGFSWAARSYPLSAISRA